MEVEKEMWLNEDEKTGNGEGERSEGFFLSLDGSDCERWC